MQNTLAQTITRLLLFRAGPQDLPTWPLLMQLAVVAYLLSTVLRLSLLSSLLPALGQSLLSLVVLAVYLRAILNFKQRPERFAQTFSALLISGSIIGLLMLAPLQALLPTLMVVAEGGDLATVEPPAMAAYAWLALSIWGLSLAGHILRHALDVTMGMGMGLAFCYEVLLILVVSLLGAA